jgi:hypothetical protein
MNSVLLGAQTNYSAIVRPLQWIVVGLIFVFFLRVIRAVYVETRPGGTRKERQPRTRGGSLEVIEPVEREGERIEIEVNQAYTLGRSVTCDIAMVNDVYASNTHARIARDDKGLIVEDLASTNGTYVNAERISSAVRVGKGDIIQVGEMILEVAR